MMEVSPSPLDMSCNIPFLLSLTVHHVRNLVIKLRSIAASKKTQAVFQTMQKGMTSSLVINFFLTAFLGIAMKQIWGIINTL